MARGRAGSVPQCPQLEAGRMGAGAVSAPNPASRGRRGGPSAAWLNASRAGSSGARRRLAGRPAEGRGGPGLMAEAVRGRPGAGPALGAACSLKQCSLQNKCLKTDRVVQVRSYLSALLSVRPRWNPVFHSTCGPQRPCCSPVMGQLLLLLLRQWWCPVKKVVVRLVWHDFFSWQIQVSCFFTLKFLGIWNICICYHGQRIFLGIQFSWLTYERILLSPLS